MSYAFPPAIQHLIEQNMALGSYASEDEVLQAALHVLSDYNATIVEIREGMAEYDQGHGEPLAKAMADIRQQLGPRT
jgi:Arc/MetJ-type ribon-helix-helix transcriptional regulator